MDAGTTSSARTDRSTTEPQRCPLCAGRAVYPAYWHQADALTWTLDLCCPECGTCRTVSLEREAAHAYNVLLFEEAAEMARAGAALAHRDAAADERLCRAFAAALCGDHILPSDF